MSDVFVLPSMDLTPAFARTQGQEENSLEGQCFKEASLRGSNGALPIGATPGEGEILILLTFIGELTSCQQ